MNLASDRMRTRQWVRFSAPDYPSACGVINKPGQLASGVPLGGIGTGCIDFNPDGRLGRHSIFNSFTPPREQSLPLLSLIEDGVSQPLIADDNASGTLSMRYWGHYPFADWICIDKVRGLQMEVRAWSPFIPGDSAASNTPAIGFEISVKRQQGTAFKGTLRLQFPIPTTQEAGPQRLREPGVEHRDKRVQVHFAPEVQLAASASHGHRAELTAEALALDFPLRLAARGTVKITVMVAWYAAQWEGTSYRHYRHMYAQRFASAAAVLDYFGTHYSDLRTRTISWQNAIFQTERWPIWLRDQLVNLLATLAKDSFWAANSVPPDDWCRTGGIFGLSESPRSVPHVAIPSDFYGSLPLVLLFPDLMRQMLRAYAHLQLRNGEIPLGLGWGADLGSPIYGFLHTTNGSTFVDLVHRLWSASHDEGILREFYPAVRDAIGFMRSLDRDGDGLLDLDPWPTGNQFYGAWHWVGTATHTNGFYLAALRMAENMARTIGDIAFAGSCAVWLEQGQGTLERTLWNGSYYDLYHDAATGKRSPTILANQLVGQLLCRLHGLPPLHEAREVNKVLKTVLRRNVKPVAGVGMLNAVRPDGRIDRSGSTHSQHMFTGEAIAVASTLIYEGFRKEGLELAHAVLRNLVLDHGRGWDPPNQIDPHTGEPTYGTDFYQMLIVWFLPLALDGHSILEAGVPVP